MLAASGIVGVSGYTIATAPNIPIVGVSTANFRITDPDADGDARPADLTVTIDWGDGTTSPGLLKLHPGPILNAAFVAQAPSFDAVGSHSYAAAGSYIITTTVTEPSEGSTTIGGTAVVVPESIALAGVPIAAAPGASLANVKVATFQDAAPGMTPGAFVATIDWGDGTPPRSAPSPPISRPNRPASPDSRCPAITPTRSQAASPSPSR